LAFSCWLIVWEKNKNIKLIFARSALSVTYLQFTDKSQEGFRKNQSDFKSDTSIFKQKDLEKTKKSK